MNSSSKLRLNFLDKIHQFEFKLAYKVEASEKGCLRSKACLLAGSTIINFLKAPN